MLWSVTIRLSLVNNKYKDVEIEDIRNSCDDPDDPQQIQECREEVKRKGVKEFEKELPYPLKLSDFDYEVTDVFNYSD